MASREGARARPRARGERARYATPLRMAAAIAFVSAMCVALVPGRASAQTGQPGSMPNSTKHQEGALLALGLWIFVKDTTLTKVAVGIAFFIVATAIFVCSVAAAAFSVAEVHDGRLTFFFLGLRTRSFSLDDGTTYEVKNIGRTQILIICRGKSTYVPNGTFDKQPLIDLLRANGVSERKT